MTNAIEIKKEYQNNSYLISRFAVHMIRAISEIASAAGSANMLMADIAKIQSRGIDILANNDPEIKEQMTKEFNGLAGDFFAYCFTEKEISGTIENLETAVLFLKVMKKESERAIK